MKILYVEDNEDNIFVLQNRLKRRGHTVVIARDGASGAIARDYHGMPLALEAALQHKDIVLIIFYIQDFHARTSLTFACWPRSIDRGSIRPSSRSSSSSSEALFRITRSTYPFSRF